MDRIELGYSALRYLNKCISIGSKLLAPKNAIMDRINLDAIQLQPTSERTIALGTVLIAHPMLVGSTLTQSIVLIVQVEQGGQIVGLVLNRPYDYRFALNPQDYIMSEILLGTGVFRGGDVDEVGHRSLLHTADKSLEELSKQISPGLFFLDDFAKCISSIQNGPMQSQMRVFHGCARWGKDQLEGEIDSNYWIACRFAKGSPRDLVFAETAALRTQDQLRFKDSYGHALWRHCLLALPTEYHSFADVVDLIDSDCTASAELSHTLRDVTALTPRLS